MNHETLKRIISNLMKHLKFENEFKKSIYKD